VGDEMIQKKYYRLNELESKFGFDQYDYIYLCEQHNNPIHFLVFSRYFVITQPDFKEIRVLGVATYKGVITLKPQDRKRLLQNDSVTITECDLLDKSGVTLYESPSQTLIESCFDERHIIKAQSFENIPNESIHARIIDEKHREMLYVEFDSLKTTLTFDIKQMILTPKDIEWAEGHLLIKESSLVKEDDSRERENTFHIYLKELMKAYPRKGASALWNHIFKEFREESDTIDPHFILRDMSPNEIIWGQENDADRTMKKSTFKNLFTRFKKIKSF
jgi:hypothetical protein